MRGLISLFFILLGVMVGHASDLKWQKYRDDSMAMALGKVPNDVAILSCVSRVGVVMLLHVRQSEQMTDTITIEAQGMLLELEAIGVLANEPGVYADLLLVPDSVQSIAEALLNGIDVSVRTQSGASVLLPSTGFRELYVPMLEHCRMN